MLNGINKPLQIQILKHIEGKKNGKIMEETRFFKILVIKVKTLFYISYHTQLTP